MGVVLAARHAQLGQKVAIKFLRRSAAANPEAVSRFLREARAVVGLQSAHVVRVMDVGTLDDGLPYMVMEHLSGTDLGELLESARALPVEEAVDYVLQADGGDRRGARRRDRPPRSQAGEPLLDGAARRVAAREGARLRNLEGRPEAAPEPMSLTDTRRSWARRSTCRRSRSAARRTSTPGPTSGRWASSSTSSSAGVPPFEAETVTGLCAKIVADPPAPLRLRRPEVPPALEAVILRCLEKDITRRPRTVAELAVALSPFASIEGRMAVDRIARIGGGARVGGASAPGVARPTSGGVFDGYAETVATHQTTRGIRRRRVATMALSGVAVLLLALLWAVRSRVGVRDASTPSVAEQAALAAQAPRPVAPSMSSDPGPAPSASALASASVGTPSALPEASAAPGPLASSKGPVRWVPQPPASHAAARPAVATSSIPGKPSSDDLLLDRK